MFNKKTDLNKLSRIRYSIDTELKLLNNKLENLYSSKRINKNTLSEIKKINLNLQNNLQYLKLMIEYNDSEIEVLDEDVDTSKVNFDDYKVEILDDLTKEIEILDDNKYKTELLDDLTREIEVLDVSDNDEIEHLEYLENTISLSLKSFNTYMDSNSKYNEHLKNINFDLKDELIDVNDKLKKRIKYLKIKKAIWTGVFIFFFIMFILISCTIINRIFDNYKVDNQIKKINKFVTYSSLEIVNISDTDPYLSSIIDQVYDGDGSTDSNYKDNYHKFISMNAMSIDFNELYKLNSDTKGWIKVDGTNINYPFVQTSDNKFYLKHSYDKGSTYMGWIFMDYRNSLDYDDKNTIIYGHGLLNDTMFGSLRKTLDYSWYSNKDNHIIKLYIEDGFKLYQVFSNYTIEPESYYITTEFDTDDDYQLFLNTLLHRSIYDYNVDLSPDDKILTLSTCYNDQKRAVLHAKLIYSSY